MCSGCHATHAHPTWGCSARNPQGPAAHATLKALQHMQPSRPCSACNPQGPAAHATLKALQRTHPACCTQSTCYPHPIAAHATDMALHQHTQHIWPHRRTQASTKNSRLAKRRGTSRHEGKTKPSGRGAADLHVRALSSLPLISISATRTPIHHAPALAGVETHTHTYKPEEVHAPAHADARAWHQLAPTGWGRVQNMCLCSSTHLAQRCCRNGARVELLV